MTNEDEPTELDTPLSLRGLLTLLQGQTLPPGQQPVSPQEQRRLDAEIRIQKRYNHYDGIGVDEDLIENGGPVSLKITRLYKDSGGYNYLSYQKQAKVKRHDEIVERLEDLAIAFTHQFFDIKVHQIWGPSMMRLSNDRIINIAASTAAGCITKNVI